MPTLYNCPNCQHILDPGAAFCGNCGQAVSTGLPSPVAQVYMNQVASPLNNQRSYTPQQAALIGGAALPTYALAAIPRQHDHTKLILAIVFGIVGALGSFLIPLLGVVLGITGIILASITPSGVGKKLRILGIILSILALVVGLGTWVFAISHQAEIKRLTTPKSATATSTAISVTTPCYTAGFTGELNIENQSGSCQMDAYNGQSIELSSNVYKVLASSAPNVSAANLVSIGQQAIDKDITQNLPNFKIVTQGSATFAGSPAYVVQAADGAKLSVIEAVVLHPSVDDNNFFVLVHATTNGSASIAELEQQWQWK